MFTSRVVRRVSTLTFFIVGNSLLFLLGIGAPSDAPVSGSEQFRLRGDEAHRIELLDAVQLTTTYQAHAIHGEFIAEAFSRDAVIEILSQPSCTGLRIYKGKKTDGSEVFVLVGVDINGADLVDGLLAETGFPCPPICNDASPLLYTREEPL